MSKRHIHAWRDAQQRVTYFGLHPWVALAVLPLMIAQFALFGIALASLIALSIFLNSYSMTLMQALVRLRSMLAGNRRPNIPFNRKHRKRTYVITK